MKYDLIKSFTLTDYLKHLADSFNLLQMFNRNLFLQVNQYNNCVVSISLNLKEAVFKG
jgi:hypothetical protein